MKNYDEIDVKDYSLETLEDEGELFGDDGLEVRNLYSSQLIEHIRKQLTNRQYQILELILQGYERKEIAEKRKVTIQSVHQIVPRIRKRIKAIEGIYIKDFERLHD